MDEKPSKIYLRTRWVPGTFKEHEKEADLNRKKGILKVLIVDAQNLRADDGATSDPYCIVFNLRLF